MQGFQKAKQHAVGRKSILTISQVLFYPLVLHYKKLLRSFYQQHLVRYVLMPGIYTVIFGFGYLSISVLTKNEEKHMNAL